MAAMQDDVDVGGLAVIGTCSTIFIYVFITLVRAIFLHLGDVEERTKNYHTTPRALAQYQEEQAKKLTGIASAMAAAVRDEAHKQQLKAAPH